MRTKIIITAIVLVAALIIGVAVAFSFNWKEESDIRATHYAICIQEELAEEEVLRWGGYWSLTEEAADKYFREALETGHIVYVELDDPDQTFYKEYEAHNWGTIVKFEGKFYVVSVYIQNDRGYYTEPPLRGITSYIRENGVDVSNIDAIFWGVNPNLTKQILIYVQNIGNTPATLTLSTRDWDPSEAQTYMTLSWNYTGQILNSNEKIPIMLTMKVSPEIKGIVNGSFTLNITATNKVSKLLARLFCGITAISGAALTARTHTILSFLLILMKIWSPYRICTKNWVFWATPPGSTSLSCFQFPLLGIFP